MSVREEFVNAAKRRIGTPFQHQGRLIGVAMDCAGVALGAMDDADIPHAVITGYSRQPDPERFRAYILDYCNPIRFDELQCGDLMTFRFAEEQHLAIVSALDPLTIIHAYEKVGKVVENPIDAVWLNRMRGCYRLKALAG